MNSKKILIVDDISDHREILKKILYCAGYTAIYEADNGKKGFQLYEKLQPDLLITDINMPLMNGYQLINNLFVLYPEVKIIVYSNEDINTKVLPYALVDGVIAKPIKSKEDVLYLLEEIFNGIDC